jgi:hypothetical protein
MSTGAAQPDQLEITNGYGFKSSDGKSSVAVHFPSGMIRSELDDALARLIGIIAITSTHVNETIVSFSMDRGNVRLNLPLGVAPSIDFRTSATAWAIADRFGIDVTPHTQLMLGAPQIEEGEDFNNVLLDVVRTLKMFENVENGVPYEWAQAYVSAKIARGPAS